MKRPDSSESIELIVIVFEEADQANQLLSRLKKLEKDGAIRLFDKATLVKDRRGKFKLNESRDIGAGRGSLFGAIVGSMVGLLGGPAGALVGAATGAAMGGVVAGKLDLGFSDGFLIEMGRNLKPGHSAVLMLAEEPWNELLANMLTEMKEEHKGKLFRHVMKSDIVTRISGLTEK